MPAPLPAVLRWPALDATGAVDAVVTTRHGGTSRGPHASLNLGLHVGDDPAAVVENRRRATAAVGCTIDDLIVANQTHGCRTAVVGATDAGRGARHATDAIAMTDALVTSAPTVAIAVLVADCVPLVLVDPVARLLGCVHAGWRGTAAGVTTAAVDTMVRLGADPARLVVGIGPAIGPEDYEVGDEVADALHATLGDATSSGTAGEILLPTGAGRWRCDLVAANTTALLRAGVAPHNVHRMQVTTADVDLFSHRRGDRGRFGVLARLIPTGHASTRTIP